MREIKFRAWDNKNKHWLMGYEYPNLGGFSLVGESILFGQWGSTFDKFLFEKDGLKGTDLIVEQFTGLKDKNGTEIYEGDILEGHSDGNGVVTWSDYDGGYDYQFKDGEIVGISEVKRHCFVIGNIHETTELLK